MTNKGFGFSVQDYVDEAKAKTSSQQTAEAAKTSSQKAGYKPKHGRK